jgi:predicted dehydrogenase
MKKIRIAQIGINKYSHANTVFKTLTMFPDVFEVVGYALVENERVKCADALFVFDGYPELSLDEILNDPTIEAVTVETDEIHLTKYATLAVEHGKHIHMEKPGSQNLADFENLIDEVRRRKKVFHTGYMYRYNPFVKQILAEVKAGEFGDIHSVEAHMDCKHLPGQVVDWLATFKGGMMFYLGCHLIDLVLQIQGEPDNIVVFNRYTGISPVYSEDYAMAVFEYKNGCSIVKSDASVVGGFAMRQLVVIGSKKTVELKPFEMMTPGKPARELYTNRTSFTSEELTDIGVEDRVDFDRYADMMLSFAKMVRGEIENPYTLDYELKLFKTILKCCGMGEEK